MAAQRVRYKSIPPKEPTPWTLIASSATCSTRALDMLVGLRDWRTAHPKATFAEIEAAVDERLNRRRAKLLGEAVLASAAADGADRPMTDRPTCQECGTRMTPRGTQDRTIIVQGDQAVTLRRSQWRCPGCGASLFPLEEELRLLPGRLSP